MYNLGQTRYAKKCRVLVSQADAARETLSSACCSARSANKHHNCNILLRCSKITHNTEREKKTVCPGYFPFAKMRAHIRADGAAFSSAFRLFAGFLGAKVHDRQSCPLMLAGASCSGAVKP